MTHRHIAHAKGGMLLLSAFLSICAAAAGQPADTVRLGEAVVTGTRETTNARQLPMTVSVIGRQELRLREEPSLLPVLGEAVPGMFVSARGPLGYGIGNGAAGTMTLRGLGGSSAAQVMVLIDGRPQYMGLFGHGIADMYQSHLAERVEVVRGPASVLYGSNAMGGVVNIVTRQPRHDGTHTRMQAAAGSYGTMTAEAEAQMRKGRFSGTLAAQYGRTDGHRDDLDFEQAGGYAKLGYRIAEHFELTGDASFTHFTSSNPGATSAPIADNDALANRGMASLALENRYARADGAVRAYFNYGRHRINDGHSPGTPPRDYLFRSIDRMAGVTAYETLRLFRGNHLTLGFDLQRFGGKAWNDYRADGRREYSADTALTDIAGYADIRQDLTPWLTADAGLRIDRYGRTGTQTVPQFGLSARLPHGIVLKAVSARGFRNPSLRELYMFTPRNPDLRPERLWNHELGFSQELSRSGLTYGVNVFYIKGENIIMNVRTNGRPKWQNSGAIENCGIELSAAWRIDRKWRIAGNYSFLHMERPVPLSPRHKAYCAATFTGGRWTAQTSLQYVDGLYLDTDGGEQERYLLWNVRGCFRLNRTVELFARGENLLAQSYEETKGFPMPRATFMAGLAVNL